MKVKKFDDISKAVIFVCNLVEQYLIKDLKLYMRVCIVLTGGKSIVPFLISLSKLSLSWERVYITLSDERWVSIDHEKSNENQLRKIFFKTNIAKAEFVSLKSNDLSPLKGVNIISKRIHLLPKPFSIVILSMGEDGHLSSLFFDKEIKSQSDVVVTQRNGLERISLSKMKLMEANYKIILVIGKERFQLLKKIKINNPLWDLYNSSLIVYVP